MKWKFHFSWPLIPRDITLERLCGFCGSRPVHPAVTVTAPIPMPLTGWHHCTAPLASIYHCHSSCIAGLELLLCYKLLFYHGQSQGQVLQQTSPINVLHSYKSLFLRVLRVSIIIKSYMRDNYQASCDVRCVLLTLVNPKHPVHFPGLEHTQNPVITKCSTL